MPKLEKWRALLRKVYQDITLLATALRRSHGVHTMAARESSRAALLHSWIAGSRLPVPGDILRGQVLRPERALAEEELVHLLAQQLPRLRIGRVQRVVVDQDRHVRQPQVVALRRHLLVDPLPQLA